MTEMRNGQWTRRILGGVVAAALIGGILYGFLPPAVDVDLAQAVRGPLTVLVEEDGKTRVRERYIVSAPLAGRLVRTALQSGDAIQANETVVATIEASESNLLDDRARAEANARVNAARAHREQTNALIERARDAEAVARGDLNRAESLLAKNALTEESYDSVRLRFRLAAHDLRVAEFNLAIADFELDQAKAAVTRFTDRPESQQPLFLHVIKAPISGRVFRIFEESATPVEVGTRLIELGDPTDLEVEVDVLSVDAVQIKPGAKVLLSHWGGATPLEARVRTVEPSAFTKISALGIEEQRVWVIADILAPPEDRGSLGDGFRVEAGIVTWESDDVLKVPAGALFRQADAWAVFTVQQSRAVLRTVRVGHTNGLETEILEGLSPGDSVILHPSDRVRPGVAIAPR